MEENESPHKTIVIISKVLYSANPHSNPITRNCNFTTRTSVCTERATTSLTNGQLYNRTNTIYEWSNANIECQFLHYEDANMEKS